MRYLIIMTLLSACGPEWSPLDAGPQDMTAVDPTPAPTCNDENDYIPPAPAPYMEPLPPWVEPEEPWDWLVPRPEPEEPPCHVCGGQNVPN
jgi:hypothetical protein